jgi:uncharacterized membrane protein
MGDQNPQDFAEKVLQSLKKSSRAVDLNDKPELDPEPVQPVTQQSTNRDFTAYFNQQEGGGQGPVTGGNKDLVIIPGFGGAASTSVSQINLYWSAPNIPDSTGVDTNVRATIYNYAVNPGVGVTLPVIVFGGYNGTQQFKPTPNYGGGTGVTARIWLNPFRGSLELDYVGLNATGIASTTDVGFMSYDSTQNKIRVGVGLGAGTAKTVAFTDDVQAASGAATTAQNIHMQVGANNVNHSVAFSLLSSGAGVALSSDAELLYNPSTNILSAGTFSGAHTGNLTGTATTAASVELRAGANNTAHSVVFSLFATGTGVGLSTDSALQYNPSTDTLSSTNFSGALTGNVTGFATTATNLNVVNADTSAAHYLHFSPVATGSGVATSSDTSLSYNPNTNILTSPTFSGNLTGQVTGNVTGTATTAASIELRAGANAVNHSVVFSLNATGTGVGLSTDSALQYNPNSDTLSSTNFSGNLTGNVTGFATTATSLNVAAGAANASHFITFTPVATGSGVATSSDTDLTYNPSTNVLTAGTFSGAFSGSITGFATTATNLNAVTTANAALHYLLFTNRDGGSGVAVSTDSTVTLQPSTNILSVGSGQFAANGITVGSASNTINTASGNLTLDSVGGQTNINDNLVITGNLTVQGTTVTVDSTVSTIVDPVIVIGSGVGGTHSTLDNNQDRGIEFRWSNAGTATTGFFGFNDTDGKFRFIPNATTTAGTNVYSGTAGTAVFLFVEATLSGNAAGTAATYTNFFGTLNGSITGNAATATTATNLNVVAGGLNASHFIHFSPFATGAGLATSSDTDLTYNPSTNVLTAGTFSGAFSGSITGFATTATNLNVVNADTSAAHYLHFSPVATGSGVATSSDTSLSYNPNTNILTSPTFSGNLTGQVTGNVTGTATTAASVELRVGANSANHSVVFSLNATGTGVGLSTDTTLLYNPGTDTLSSTTFSGALTGNAATATTARNLNVVNADTSAAHYLLFSPVATGSGVATSSDTSLSYNPNTNILTSPTFSGNLTGQVTGNVTGFATTATNLNVVNADTSAAHYLHFSPVATGSGVATSSDTSLSYNPNTNILTSPTFSGNLTGQVTGNVTGFATTATNINVVSTSASTDHFILFTPVSGGSGVGVSVDSTLKYIPSTDTLSVSTITPVTVTNSAALTSGTYLTVKTNASDDSSTSDFFIRGLTSGDVSKFSVDANGNLRATTKSFDIPHPTKEGMRLVYGVLEGPEHGVYHRGTIEGKGNLLIELPDYWSELVNEDFTVTLTPHGNYGVHIVEKSLNSFIISLSGNLISKKFKAIKVDYLVHGSRKDAPLIIEQL